VTASVYRLPTSKSLARGPLTRCPACDTSLLIVVGRTMRFCDASRPVCCAPDARAMVGRRGWWVFSRRVYCDEPGVHLHQRCGACGWRGVLLPSTVDA
jgi:hypothetical protein